MADGWNSDYNIKYSSDEQCECDISLELLHAVERDFSTNIAKNCSDETDSDEPCAVIKEWIESPDDLYMNGQKGPAYLIDAQE